VRAGLPFAVLAVGGSGEPPSLVFAEDTEPRRSTDSSLHHKKRRPFRVAVLEKLTLWRLAPLSLESEHRFRLGDDDLEGCHCFVIVGDAVKCILCAFHCFLDFGFVNRVFANREID
jgi:hypothetical protein